MRAFLWLPVLMLSGCALDAGEGFAVLEPTVRAEYTDLPGRDAGNGFQQLASDYQVRVDVASLGVSSIELLGSSGGGGGTSTFDPSSPPPGYTLCHNGHCHRDDGALIPYDQVEAEVSGGGGSTTSTVASLAVDGDLDLLAPRTFELSCEPDCELPSTTVSRGRWALTALELEGVARDSRASPRFAGERPFRIALTTTGADAEPLAVLAGDLDVPSDRGHKPRVLLDLRLVVTPALFDALDWNTGTPGADGVVDLDATENTALRTALLERVAALAPEAEIQREDR